MPGSGIRDMMHRIANMDDVINVAPGEPDFPTPAHIVAAGIEALQAGHTKYGNNAGLPIAGDGTITHVFDLAAMRSDVNATLAIESAKRNAGPLPAPGKGHTAIDISQLRVVAFVQQATATDMPNVLQTAQTPVVFVKTGK